MVRTALATAPGKKPVVFAADPAVALVITDLGLWESSTNVLITGPGPLEEGWSYLDTLMNREDGEMETDEETAAGSAILFTSGTTSLPKGILSDASTHSLFVESWADSRPREGVYAGSKLCCILPNSHSFAHYMAISTQCVGAAIVYPPGAQFEPQAMLRACSLEKVTQVRVGKSKSGWGELEAPMLTRPVCSYHHRQPPPLDDEFLFPRGRVGSVLTTPIKKHGCDSYNTRRHLRGQLGSVSASGATPASNCGRCGAVTRAPALMHAGPGRWTRGELVPILVSASGLTLKRDSFVCC